jgi:hypothetical protein
MAAGDLTSRRSERRWAQRFAFDAPLEIEWGSALLRAKTRDISLNGMFIESPDTLWVGAGFSARLLLERPVQIDCSVKRIEPGRGMGVSIALSGADHQQRYQTLLSALSGRGSSEGV